MNIEKILDKPEKPERIATRGCLEPARLLNLSLWVIVVALLFPLYLQLALDDPLDYSHGGLGAGDFKEYYIAARLMAKGQDIYNPQLQSAEAEAVGLPHDNLAYLHTAYIYPSFLAIALMPLGNLSASNAARVWNLMNLVLLVVSLLLITFTFDLHRRMGRHYPWIIILFALAAPTMVSLRIGQVNILILFLLALCLFGGQKLDYRLTGLALALATFIKVFPVGLVAFYFWRKQYRVVMWCIGGMVAVIIASTAFLAFSGRDVTTDIRYLTQVLPSLTAPIPLDNQSLNGFLSRFGIEVAMERIVVLVLSIVILLITFAAVEHAQRDDTELDFSVVLTALLLVSPITWWSTLVLLVIPFGLLINANHRRNNPNWLYALLILSYLLISSPRLLSISSMNFAGSPWLIAFPFFGTLLLWAGVVTEAFRVRQNNVNAPIYA
jgi:hypothetical protein